MLEACMCCSAAGLGLADTPSRDPGKLRLAAPPALDADGQNEDLVPHAAGAARASFNMGNAIWIPGPKHMIDNIIGDMLERLTMFSWFQEHLRAAADMLSQKHYLDRLRFKIFSDTEFSSLFTSFEGGSLIMWRWSSLINVCKAVRRRKGPLRAQLCCNSWLATMCAHSVTFVETQTDIARDGA